MPSTPLRQLCLAPVLAALLTSLTLPIAVCATDLTPGQVQVLESAVIEQKTTYARNIWDMQVFDGRLWLGHGDSADNRGPVPVVTFDGSSFSTVGVRNEDNSTRSNLQEEQLDKFRVIDGKLWIPGHDPRNQSWALGNYYVYEPGATRIQKYRNLPNGIHAYDLYKFDGKLYAALGTGNATNSQGPFLGQQVVASSDGGQTWTGVDGSAWSPYALNNYDLALRAYALFEVGGNLYASEPSRGLIDNGPVQKIDGDGSPIAITNSYGSFSTVGGSARIRKLMPDGQFGSTDISIADAFPDAPTTTWDYFLRSGQSLTFGMDHRVHRPTNFGDRLVYLGVTGDNDHHWDPFGLYHTGDFADTMRVALGEDVKAWDLLLVSGGDELLVLLSEALDSGKHRVSVQSTTDLLNWQEIVGFEAETFARSFELFQDDLYFGLGSPSSNIAAATGDILKVDGSLFTLQIPEPGVLTLAAVATLALVVRRGRRA